MVTSCIDSTTINIYADIDSVDVLGVLLSLLRPILMASVESAASSFWHRVYLHIELNLPITRPAFYSFSDVWTRREALVLLGACWKLHFGWNFLGDPLMSLVDIHSGFWKMMLLMVPCWHLKVLLRTPPNHLQLRRCFGMLVWIEISYLRLRHLLLTIRWKNRVGQIKWQAAALAQPIVVIEDVLAVLRILLLLNLNVGLVLPRWEIFENFLFINTAGSWALALYHMQFVLRMHRWAQWMLLLAVRIIFAPMFSLFLLADLQFLAHAIAGLPHDMGLLGEKQVLATHISAYRGIAWLVYNDSRGTLLLRLADTGPSRWHFPWLDWLVLERLLANHGSLLHL